MAVAVAVEVSGSDGCRRRCGGGSCRADHAREPQFVLEKYWKSMAGPILSHVSMLQHNRALAL